MKKIALMAVAALVALGSAGNADAATYSLDTQVNSKGNVTAGFNTDIDEGPFTNRYTFDLPFVGRLLSSQITIALLDESEAIQDLTLSLWKDMGEGAMQLASASDVHIDEAGQDLDLLYQGTLDANSSYYLQTSGSAPVGLSMGGSLNVAPVPVPAALPLFGAALAGLAFYKRKKRVDEAA